MAVEKEHLVDLGGLQTTVESIKNYAEKNRTHYTETVAKEIVPLQTVTPSYAGLYYNYTFNAGITITAGRTYKIVLNGTEYICVAQEYVAERNRSIDSIVYMGDASMTYLGRPFQLGDKPINKYPSYDFLIHQTTQTFTASGNVTQGQLILTVQSSLRGDVSISITEYVEVVHKLDEKYMPYMLVNISADSNGNPTADKTNAEICEAVENGMDVLLWDGLRHYTLGNCTDTAAYFGHTDDTAVPWGFEALRLVYAIVDDQIQTSQNMLISESSLVNAMSQVNRPGLVPTADAVMNYVDGIVDEIATSIDAITTKVITITQITNRTPTYDGYTSEQVRDLVHSGVDVQFKYNDQLYTYCGTKGIVGNSSTGAMYTCLSSCGTYSPNYADKILWLNFYYSGYYTVDVGETILQTKRDLVTEVSSTSTDKQYPSAKAVYSALPILKTWTSADVEAST